MKMLQEMNNEIKRQNFVAKHSRNMSGAGEHEVKTKHSKKKRLRDKKNLRKELKDY